MTADTSTPRPDDNGDEAVVLGDREIDNLQSIAEMYMSVNRPHMVITPAKVSALIAAHKEARESKRALADVNLRALDVYDRQLKAAIAERDAALARLAAVTALAEEIRSDWIAPTPEEQTRLDFVAESIRAALVDQQPTGEAT